MSYLICILRWLVDLSAILIGPSSPEELLVTDIEIKKFVKLRVYKPKFKSRSNSPIIIYYHGGGWIIGSIKAYDKVFRYLCNKSNCTVVAVEYRKAPKHKFPVAHEDALFAYKWVSENTSLFASNKDKVVLMGDSAGGNMAAFVEAKLRKKRNSMTKLLVLIYPIVDVTKKTLNTIKNDSRLSSKYGRQILYFCLYKYLGVLSSKKLSKLSLPVKFEDISNFPKTLIITSEIDALTTSIKIYEKKLKETGIKVISKHYSNTIHGFINFAGVSKSAKEALDNIISTIKNNRW